MAIGVVRDTGIPQQVQPTQQQVSIGVVRDIPQVAKPSTEVSTQQTQDLRDFVKLGDDSYVSKESFEQLPEDTKDVGIRVGLNALKSSLETHQKNYAEVVESLKPFTNETGEINLVNALQSGQVDVNKIKSEKIFGADTDTTIDKVSTYVDAIQSLKPYTSENKIDLVSAIKAGIDTNKLVLSGVLTDADIANAKNFIAQEQAYVGGEEAVPTSALPRDPIFGIPSDVPPSEWRPDFTKDNPYEGMPVGYQELEAAGYTGEGLPPSQAYALTHGSSLSAGGLSPLPTRQWKPDFTKENPYEGMPEWYPMVEAAGFTGVGLPPSQAFVATGGKSLTAEGVSVYPTSVGVKAFDELVKAGTLKEADVVYEGYDPYTQMISYRPSDARIKEVLKSSGEYIEVKDGLYSKEEFEKLSPQFQQIAMNEGVNALSQKVQGLQNTFKNYESDIKAEDGKTSYDTQKIISALNQNALSEDDLKSYFGSDADAIITLKDTQNNVRGGLVNLAQSKNISITDKNNLTVDEMKDLIKNDVEPLMLVSAGFNIDQINEAADKALKESQLAVAPYGEQIVGVYTEKFPELQPVQNLETLAKFQRENPNDTTTLKTLYGSDLSNTVEDYNKKVGAFVSAIDTELTKRSDDFFQGKGGITKEAAEQMISAQRAFDKLNIKVENLKGESTRSVWTKLDTDTKYKVADLMLQDPARGSFLGGLGADIDLLAQKNLALSLVSTPIQPITHVVGKQITLEKAKEILGDTYKTELNATQEFKQDNGTIDTERLQNKMELDGDFRKKILDQTGDTNTKDLIEKLNYYNNGIRVTGEEWVIAGATGALDVLGLGIGGAGASLATRIGAGAVQVGSAAVFIPSAVRTVTNPTAGIGEKVLAGATPILLVVGGGLGLRGKAPLSERAQAKATLGVPIKPQAVAIERALDDVSVAGRTTKTIVSLKALPEVTVQKLNDALENVNKLADEIMSGRINESVRNGVKITIQNTKDGLIELGQNVRYNYENSIQRLNNSLENINKLADEVMSGRLSANVVANIKVVGENLRTNLSNIKDVVGVKYENTIQSLNASLDNINKFADYIMSGNLSADVRMGLVSSLNKIKETASTLSSAVGKTYEESIQKLNTDLENINKLADDLISGRASEKVKELINSVKNNVGTTYYNAKTKVGSVYEDSIQALNSKLEVLNTIADKIMSGQASETLKREFLELAKNTKDSLVTLKKGATKQLDKSIDRINDALENINKLADWIMKDKQTPNALFHFNYLKRIAENLKEDFNVELNIAELERQIKTKIADIQERFDAKKINEAQVDQEIFNLQRSPEWIEHQSLVKELGNTFQKRLTEYYDYKISRLDMALELIARNLVLGDEVARMKLPYDLKVLMNDGDSIGFNNEIEQLKLKAADLPYELREATLKELDVVKNQGNEYIGMFKKSNGKPEADDLTQQIESESNELNNAQRLREKVTNPEIRRNLDDNITKRQESLERKKVQLAEKLKDPFKDVQWFKEVTPEESARSKVAETKTKELAKTEEPRVGEKPLPKETPTPTRELAVSEEAVKTTEIIPTETAKSDFVPKEERVYDLMSGKMVSTRTGLPVPEEQIKVEGEEQPAPEETAKPVSIFEEAPSEEIQAKEVVAPVEVTKPVTETVEVTEIAPKEITRTETKTITETKTQTELQPAPLRAYAVKLEEDTRRLKVAKIPKMSLEQEQEYQKIAQKPAVIQWRQGAKWILLPPREDGSYHTEDLQYFDKPLPNTRKFATGKGSAHKTLDIINGVPKQDADIDLGWTQIHISTKGRELQMSFGGGKEAADTRWAEEQAKMDELSRQAYQDLPKETMTQKIKGIRQPKRYIPPEDTTAPQRPEGIVKPTVFVSPEKLNKELIPEYSTEDLKVYSVDGEAIRDELGDKYIGNRMGIDYVAGGHYGVYWNLIPYDEIWVEKNLGKEGTAPVVLHEIDERNDMLTKNMRYEEAHDAASNIEVESRTHPQETQELIRKELEDYEARIQKQKENDEGLKYVAGYYRKPKPIERRERPSNVVENFRPKYYLGRRIRGSGLANSI